MLRAALAGVLLLVSGIGFAAVDAQLRIDAAKASIAFTPEEREQLDEAGMPDIGQDSALGWLVTSSLLHGTPVLDLALDIENVDESYSVSWGPSETPVVRSIGGWQFKPLGLLSVAGLGMLLGSGFVAAARWRPASHPSV